jgi:hypothetical protein
MLNEFDALKESKGDGVADDVVFVQCENVVEFGFATIATDVPGARVYV